MTLLCTVAMLLLSGVCQEQKYQELPLLITAYNPLDGGVNCNDDCATFGTGVTITSEHFNIAAACPTEWVRLDRTAVITIQGIDYLCLDNFGSVENRYPVYVGGEWYLRIDLVLREPELWGVQITNDWSMRWQ